MRWQLQRRIHELLTPSQASHGAVFTRELLLLRLTDGEHIGWGEAAPIASYNGITVDQADADLRAALDLLSGQDPDDPDATLNAVEQGICMPARAALEVALRDLAARRAGISLLESFGESAPEQIDLRALLTSTSVAEAGPEAEAAADKGYMAMKAKVGNAPELDIKRLAEIRESVGSGIHLSADANGAFEVDAAEAFLQAAAETIDLAEQPVLGLDSMRLINTVSPVPIALDEDSTEPGALDVPLAASCVCLKLQAWGGIDRLVAAAGKAKATGLNVTYGSTLEGPIGISASLIAAQVAPADIPSGLGTLTLFRESFPALKVRDGRLSVPTGIGLGLAPDGTEC